MSDTQATRRKHLRQQLRARREALPPANRIAAAQGVCRSLETLPAFVDGHDIGGYWAGGGEVPLNLVLAGMQRRGQAYWLPRTRPERRLEFARWAPGDAIENNRYGIPEPVAAAASCSPRELDVVLVPLLGFDARGNRLGMGGGYYDTSFAFLQQTARPARPLLAGIAHDFQQLESVPAAAWDIPLDYVATASGLITCRPAQP